MTIYLHHYPASLFSEKVRVLLGYLQLDWCSVETSNIMPRPLLMPLTGGYRKTPTLQIDANVYCDTAVIAHALARHTQDDTLYAPGFVAHRIAEWADSQLFKVAVVLSFRPEAMAGLMSSMSAADMAAFQEDRAKLADGAPLVTFTPPAALAYIDQYLKQLEAALGAPNASPFLFGDKPSIADFSVYHCLWFINNNDANKPLFDGLSATKHWMQTIAAFGHGNVVEKTGEDALATALANDPVAPPITRAPANFVIGAQVSVAPIDYGRIPVTGSLVAWDENEVVLERETPETGRIMTHFPSAGFEVTG